MNTLLTRTAAVIAACITLAGCNDGWVRPQGTDGKSEEKPGPTKEQLEQVSDFITIAIATDDYLSSIVSKADSLILTTISGETLTVPIHIDVIPEGGSTTGLDNYIIDGTRYAEFCLGGVSQSIPSDIHQWYNPPLVKGNGNLNVLFIGGGFTADATDFLPKFIKGSGSTTISLERLTRDEASLDDIILDDEFAFNTALSGADSWSDEGAASIRSILRQRDWDVVTIMEDPVKAATGSFDKRTAEKIDSLSGEIFKACTKGRPTLLMMLPPSLPADNQVVVDSFGGDRMAMFEAISDYGRNVTSQTLIFDVVSISAAIQDLCGADVFVENPMTCDGTRLDRGAGIFTAAGAVFCKIVETCTDLLFIKNTTVSVSGSSEEGRIATSVNNTNLGLCRNAAKYAVLSPFEYFDLNSLHTTAPTEGLPDVGYEDSGVVFGEDEDPDGPGPGPDPAASLELSFNFAPEVSGQMPKGALNPEEINAYAPYHSFCMTATSGKSYKFYNAGGCYHGEGKNYMTIHDGKGTGYLGLPAVAGYKLTQITADRTNATGATVTLEILSDVAAGTRAGGPYTWTAGAPAPAPIILTGTKENTVYYIHSLNNSYVPMNGLTLKYEKAGSSDAHATDYDVFLFIGQSNMAGRGDVTKADCAPLENVYLFTDGDNTAVYAAQPLLNVESTVRKAVNMQKFNLAGPFASKVSKVTGHKVLIVLNARGETQIEAWLKGAAPATYGSGDDSDKQGKTMPGLYSEAVRRAKEACKYGTLRAVLWHQGEGNANEGQVPYYMPKLKSLAADLRSDLGMSASSLPLIVGEINHAYSWAVNLNPYLNSVSSEIENSACASAEGCGANSDNVHFNTEGLTILGERYADEYLRLAGYTK